MKHNVRQDMAHQVGRGRKHGWRMWAVALPLWLAMPLWAQAQAQAQAPTQSQLQLQLQLQPQASGSAYAQPSPALPDDAAVGAALQATPAWLGALQRHQAELARGSAVAANPNEWTPSASWAQRRARADAAALSPAEGSVRTREWAVGLSRGVRLPAKAEAASAAGQSQGARADAQLAMDWHALVGTWLDDAVALLQAARQAQLLAAQLELWTQQQQAVARRQALGDASRQELLLLDAARAQAQAQSLQAQQRWLAAQALWRSRYPGLMLPHVQRPPQMQTQTPTSAQSEPRLAPMLPGAADAAEALEGAALDARLTAWLEAHPRWRLARLEADATEAQARLSATERQPDPTLGVQLGRERSGAERIVEVSVSWPLGSEVRSLQSRAAWADAEAARAAQADAQRELQRSLTQWHAEWRSSQQVWLAAQQALAQTRQAAQAVRKGYELGEGSLSEVLLLQRQWLDQQQATSDAELETLRARWRWQLETGARWAWASEGLR
jgi:cobalt-zinc-cadmium efflux system outer membrane protein